MKNILNRLKQGFIADNEDDSDGEDEYVELDTTHAADTKDKLVIKPFSLDDFSDVKLILDSMRNGTTVALVNIKPLKDKDIVELKRAINKLKKTSDATSGTIAGFGDDWIVIAPSAVEIQKNPQVSTVKE